MHNGEKTHCPYDHALEGDNLYIDPKGGRRCRACARRHKKQDPSTEVPTVSVPESGNDWVRVLESPPGVRLETLDQFLTHYRVDLDTWEVEKHVLNRYPVTVKGNDGEPIVLHSFQIKVWLRLRKAKETLEELKAAILADIRTASTYRPFPRPKTDPDKMLVIEPVDAHLGALAWGRETGGTDYDLGIAARLYREAVEGLLGRTVHDKPAAIVLRIGDDYLHIDSDRNQTTAGTPQDVDSRYKKVFRTGVSVAAHCIRRCAELAPTQVVIVPGNHDNQSTFAVGECLAAMFAEDPRVMVNPVITPRIYIEWGVVLLCFAHGDKEVPATLPLLMATEQREMWARTTVREVHLGHLHRRRQMSQDEFQGVRVRWLPSIKAADSWHAGKGFVGAQRTTEGHLYSRTRGYLGTYAEPVELT